MNATVNSSLPARAVLGQIQRTKEIVESQIAFAESMRYPEFILVANTDSDAAVIEWAITEFAWTVMKNFGPTQHFRIACDEMVREFSEIEWRMGPVR